MHVARLGLTPVKGGRHRTLDAVELAATGPVGDRVFALVDPVARRCLRTIENPALLAASAAWDGRVLSVDLPGGTLVGEPTATGEVLDVDYWGRSTTVEVVDGPWTAAYAALLGREVVMVRAAPGAVVYGAAVTVVTGASLARLGEEVGAPVDAARFRATVQLDGDLPAHAEDGWVGRRLRLGEAQLRVRGVVPRCAVIDLDPRAGGRDLALMRALAAYRPRDGEVAFGVDAEVVVPGIVTTGDPAVVGPEAVPGPP
jgi:uncharacterized protein YcbX